MKSKSWREDLMKYISVHWEMQSNITENNVRFGQASRFDIME